HVAGGADPAPRRRPGDPDLRARAAGVWRNDAADPARRHPAARERAGRGAGGVAHRGAGDRDPRRAAGRTAAGGRSLPRVPVRTGRAPGAGGGGPAGSPPPPDVPDRRAGRVGRRRAVPGGRAALDTAATRRPVTSTPPSPGEGRRLRRVVAGIAKRASTGVRGLKSTSTLERGYATPGWSRHRTNPQTRSRSD